MYNGVNSHYARKLPNSLNKKAARLLDQINAAPRVETLDMPPSNKLRKLSGNYADFWRIKIDKQWAIIFKWDSGHAMEPEFWLNLQRNWDLWHTLRHHKRLKPILKKSSIKKSSLWIQFTTQLTGFYFFKKWTIIEK